ncbi:mitochondrial 18 KDa protein-domain-containing protein [Obelidium mucronatum]|nr:mitochondrial 18 KDa protein-domain-containing protein [Obelidium mucronatum]
MFPFMGLFCTKRNDQQAKAFLISSPEEKKEVARDDHSSLDDIDTVDTPARYLGLLGRVRNVVMAQSRLMAYTSEVGEAFRPIASPMFVTGAYAVSWAYVLGDVGFETYKMKEHGAKDVDLARTALERGIFQSLASMVLPAYTVHWVVHQSSHLFKNAKPGMLKRFGPSGLGLATIPFLPLIFDKPVEHAIEFAFDSIWPLTEEGTKAQIKIHGTDHGFHVKKE